MKFGTPQDPVHQFSFRVVTGFASSEDPLKESVKYLTHVDGSIEVIRYGGVMGARQERMAEFALAQIPKAAFVTLVDFLSARTGEKIRVEEENEGEKLFTESFLSQGPITYHAYLLEVGGLQEEDFSTTRSLFSLNLKIAFAARLTQVDIKGEFEIDPLNSVGTSQLDVLIEIDTVRAKVIAPSEEVENGDPIPVDFDGPFVQGDRWLDISNESDGTIPNFMLREFTETGVDEEGKPIGNWVRVIYPVPKDIFDLGFRKGIFRLSAFADQDIDFNPENEKNAPLNIRYRSGWINYQSIDLPGKSINISKGPAIAHREGFSFSINNSNGTEPKKFWAFLIENSINLFGARVSISIYRNKGGVGEEPTVTKLMSGVNRSNSFSYTDYKFQVEPFLLSSSTKFPTRAIDPREERYADVRLDLVGKTPYVTYGEHDMAALQNISSRSKILEFGFRYRNAINSMTGLTPHLVGYIDRGYVFNPANSDREQDAGELGISKDFLKRIVIPSKFKHDGGISGNPTTFEVSATQAADIQTGNHIVTITFDSEEEQEKNNSKKSFRIRKFIRNGAKNYTIAGHTEQGGHYCILEDAAGELIVPVQGGLDTPGTNNSIGLLIAKAAYKFQSGEEESGGFGVFADGLFTSGGFALFNLKESGKELVQLPTTAFEQDVETRTVVQVDPVLASGSAQGISFRDSLELFGEATAPLSTKIAPLLLPEPGSEIALEGGQFAKAPFYKASSDADRHPFVVSRRIAGQNAARVSLVGSSLSQNEVTVNIKPDYTTTQQGQSAFTAILLRFPINHNNDPLFATPGRDVRLAFNALLQSVLKVRFKPGENREIGIGFKVMVRFRRFDGAYVEGEAKPFLAAQLSLADPNPAVAAAFGQVRINNMPDGDRNGNFNSPENTLPEFYQHLIRYRFAPGQTLPKGLFHGELAWQDKNAPATNTLLQWNETANNNAGAWESASFEAGDKVYRFQAGPGGLISDNYFVIEADGANFLLTKITEPVAAIQNKKGGDLFDLSEFFVIDAANRWEHLESMEILLIPTDDPRKTVLLEKKPGLSLDNIDYKLSIQFFEPPRLLFVDRLQIENRPAFSALQGKKIFDGEGNECGFPTPALCVAADLLQIAYPGNFESAKVFEEASLKDSRSGAQWTWRKQFTKPVPSAKILQEILDNLWAAGIFDSEDKILLKSLHLPDHGEPRLFDESLVLKDSVQPPRFRNANENYQVFKLDYDYFPPSEFSNALEKYRKRMVLSGEVVEDSLSFLLRASRDLYGLLNEYETRYDYHYSPSSLPHAEWVIRWLAFNSWTLKFTVSLDQILGDKSLELMDPVSLKNFFYTRVPGAAKDFISGFVVSINPNIYEGTAEIGLYTPEPPGFSGPACDPFNDALEIPDRGEVELRWADEGRQNDAGPYPRTEIPFHKDAGAFPRVITC